MNCLAYALRFWDTSPNYVLHYNSDHVINLPKGITTEGFLPIEEFGYSYFANAFDRLLDPHEEKLLKKYFAL